MPFREWVGSQAPGLSRFGTLDTQSKVTKKK